MVNKILNWTAGGFFRSLGRILVYVAIGLLISLFLNKSGLKITDILGFETVYASDKGYASSAFHAMFMNSSGSDYVDSGWINVNNGYNTISPTNIMRGGWIRIVGSNSYIYKVNNSYTLSFNLAYNPKHRNYVNKLYCGKDVLFSVYGGTQASSTGITTDNIQSFSVSCSDNPFDDYAVKYIVRFTPTTNLQYILIRFEFLNWFIYYDYADYSGYPYQLSAFNYNGLKIDEQEGVNSVIEKQTQTIINQTEIINNSINSLTNTIEDDNVSDDSNDMADFLNDYEFSNDGLISSLVNAPITFLSNVLTNDSTNDFCRTFRGKNICIPNGKIIWSRSLNCDEDIMLCDHNYTINDFKTYFSLVVGGYLFFKMLRTFITTSEKAIDPKENKVEVMSL